jgi:hypothetical protein
MDPGGSQVATASRSRKARYTASGGALMTLDTVARAGLFMPNTMTPDDG